MMLPSDETVDGYRVRMGRLSPRGIGARRCLYGRFFSRERR